MIWVNSIFLGGFCYPNWRFYFEVWFFSVLLPFPKIPCFPLWTLLFLYGYELYTVFGPIVSRESNSINSDEMKGIRFLDMLENLPIGLFCRLITISWSEWPQHVIPLFLFPFAPFVAEEQEEKKSKVKPYEFCGVGSCNQIKKLTYVLYWLNWHFLLLGNKQQKL